jgi:NADH-quinone oxidoreductase subunit N
VIGLGPVTILLAAAAGMAVLRLLATGRGGALAGTGIALLGVLGAGTTLVSSPMDSWSRAAGILVLVGGLPGVLATRGRSPARETDLRMVLLVLLAAAVLAVSAEDWIALTAAFGLLTLTGTLLAGAGPRGFEAERARPALAVEGAALGLFLFGAALASGMAGTTELDGLARLPEETPGATGCALLLILAAPALRLSAWPFPGGPGGTPGPVASGLLAATGATVGVGVAGRILIHVARRAAAPGGLLPGPDALPASLLALLGLATATVAALAALRARGPALVARLAALRGGLALIALSTGTTEGRVAALAETAATVLLVPAAFLAVADAREGRGGRVVRWVLLLGLLGLPPTVGWVGRLSLCTAMSGAGFPVLALVAGILGVLPVGATIRTAAAPREAGGPERGGLRAPFAATAALLAVLAGVVAEPLLRWIQAAAALS